MYSPPRYGSSQGYTTTYRYAPTTSHPHNPPPSSYTRQFATPTKDSYRRHVRSGSHGVPPTYAAYGSSPHPAAAPGYYASPAGASPYYYSSPPPRQQAEYVSATAAERRPRASVRRPSQSDGSKIRISMDTKKSGAPKSSKTSRSQNVHPDGVFDDDEGYFSGKGRSPPPPYDKYASGGVWVTDSKFYDPQVPSYKVATDTPTKSKSSRQRSASYSVPHTSTSHSRSKSSSKPKAPPKATAADAARAHIPAGFSYKNWDPTEEPILLLGSAFDANSLGKWIYDFTVYYKGPATPMSDVAGDLWLLLIQLAGKIKRAEECLPRIRHHEERDLVEEFLASGDRLWQRFSIILKACEEYMWRVAQKEAKKKGGSGSAAITMGTRSGCEFVETIFGRDRQLTDTEKLMAGIRLWSHRFDVNCEDIMRHPAA